MMNSTTNIALDPPVDVNSVVIDEQELERAQQDPAVREIHATADEFLTRLKRENRDF
jgi:hypothetical protein